MIKRFRTFLVAVVLATGLMATVPQPASAISTEKCTLHTGQAQIQSGHSIKRMDGQNWDCRPVRMWDLLWQFDITSNQVMFSLWLTFLVVVGQAVEATARGGPDEAY